MPPKTLKTQIVANESTPLEKLQSEWTAIAKELALYHEKIDQLDARREELALRMWKQMNDSIVEPQSSTIIETPTIDVKVPEIVPEKTTKAKAAAKTSAKTKAEPEVEEPKKTKGKAKSKTEDIEVEVVKKAPVKKVVKKSETINETPVAKGKTTIKKSVTSAKETEELKAKLALMTHSSSSDTDLESLSSCSSESEGSGGEDD